MPKSQPFTVTFWHICLKTYTGTQSKLSAAHIVYVSYILAVSVDQSIIISDT